MSAGKICMFIYNGEENNDIGTRLIKVECPGYLNDYLISSTVKQGVDSFVNYGRQCLIWKSQRLLSIDKDVINKINVVPVL